MATAFAFPDSRTKPRRELRVIFFCIHCSVARAIELKLLRVALLRAV
jgi:hypothetical protein